MGTYFNPDNQSFRQALNSEVYVDKTGLLKILNKMLFTESKCIALSHARRFGKSQAAGMIDAYYSLGSDSKELFSPFEIAKDKDFEKHLNKYNVIHLDISSIADFHKKDLVATIKKRLYDEFKEVYKKSINYEEDVHWNLNEIYKKSGKPFVIIIDEWDCVVRNFSDDQDLVHEYLQFLHSLFKSEESKSFLALAYITGILPIKKIRNESALNNFVEYTMIHSGKLTPYFGFTEDEVKTLCQKYDMDFNSVKGWYDGYLIDGQHIYNPNSVVFAMSEQKLRSYWKNTSSFETINDLIGLNFDGLKEDVLDILKGEKITVNVNGFQNDLSIIKTEDDALTALIHLGYLGYDEEREKAYMPNYEVSLAYQAALSISSWENIAKSIAKCEQLLWATIDKNEEKVAELLELAHETYTSVLKYNNENSLSCVLTMAYFTAPAYYSIFRELPSGKGFADFAFVPRKEAGIRPAMIVELKCDKDADTAIKQIKENRYAGKLKDFSKKILLVGINYDKNTKKHECRIEEWN